MTAPSLSVNRNTPEFAARVNLESRELLERLCPPTCGRKGGDCGRGHVEAGRSDGVNSNLWPAAGYCETRLH